MYLFAVELRREGRCRTTIEGNLISHPGENTKDSASVPLLDYRALGRPSISRLGQCKTEKETSSRQSFVFLDVQDGTISVWTPNGELKVTKSIAVSDEQRNESKDVNRIVRRLRVSIKH